LADGGVAAAAGSGVALTRLTPYAAYVHGAYLILLDGINLGLGLNELAANEARAACQRFLTLQLTPLLGDAAAAAALVAEASLKVEEVEGAPSAPAAAVEEVRAQFLHGADRSLVKL
jgi:hypothetical protein